ncbi:MAG: PKD domain-containing protein [Candidatus Hydrogenedens sp.]|nr:PKD domain-containing protein [Candidatus Hydrogenedens sp.]
MIRRLFRPGLGLALFAIAALGAFPAAAQNITILRSIGGDGTYSPGGTVDVTITFLKTGTGAITQLGLQETIPQGWTFNSLVSGATPQIPPGSGAGGTLNFGWVAIPNTFPANFTYRLNVPSTQTGRKAIAGKALYARGGGTLESPVITTLISQGAAAEGEPEGSVDGEGETGPGDSELFLARTILGDGTYPPGGTLDIRLNLTRSGSDQFRQLGLVETLPAGWKFDRVVSGQLPAIQPTTGKQGDLAFAWISIPNLPASLTYRVTIPVTSTGTKALSGIGIYEAGGGQKQTAPVVSNIDEGTEVTPDGEGMTEGEGGTGDDITFTREGANSEFYTPGATFDLRVRVEYGGATPVQQLGIEDTLPDGWTYVGLVSGNTPPIAPQDGDSGTIGFAYITVPAFPIVFTYRVRAPLSATGEQSVTGEALYAFNESQLRTPTVVTALASSEEIEGELEGLVMRRASDETVYVPGEELPIDVAFTYQGVDRITTFGFEETLPDGWAFGRFVSGTDPPVLPFEGDQGTLVFAWIDPPDFPLDLRYTVVPTATAGDQSISGQGLYRTSGDELRTGLVVTTFSDGSTAEGEGMAEGEGEGTIDGEPSGDSPILLKRKILTGNGYTPGDIIDVELSVVLLEPLETLAFGINEFVPPGFEFVEMLGSELPPIRPGLGSRDELSFAWITPPPLPLTISYRMRVDANVTGSQTITGVIQYRTTGSTINSPPAVSNLALLLPSDLALCEFELPSVIYQGDTFDWFARVLNQGQSGINPIWNDCLYLSTDNTFGGDTQLVCKSNNERLRPRSQYLIGESVSTPGVAPGNYFFFVRLDAEDSVEESDKTNNLSAPIPVRVEGVNYEGFVRHQIVVNDQGQGEVRLRGGASEFFFGSQVPFVPVLVEVTLRGITRTIPVTTGSDGRFDVAFEPLPTEAGRYSITAHHPGVPKGPEQDTFTLNLMRIAYDGHIVSLSPGLSTKLTVQATNLGETALSNVNVSVQDVPDGITAQASITATIGPNSSVPLEISLLAPTASDASGVMQVVVQSTQGVGTTMFLPYQVLDGVPNFTIEPSVLLAGAVPGEQTIFAFDVANIGGGTAENFTVVAPDLPWVSTVAPAVPFNLGAQQTGRVVFQLVPPVGTPLGLVSSQAFLQFGEDDLIPLTLDINVVSSSQGGLSITVVDENTLTDEPDFRVAGAVVTLRDPETGATMGKVTSNNNGNGQFVSIPSGAYNLEARVPGYGVYRDVQIIDSGTVTNRRIVLNRNYVDPKWDVLPSLAESDYAYVDATIVDDSSPAPLVTFDPPVIDLETFYGNQTLREVTVRNEGDETARNVRLVLGDHPTYDLTPLVSELGDLAPGSSVTVPIDVRIVVGSEVDCLLRAPSGVTYSWLRNNVAVYRAHPLAVRLPRFDCGLGSRPLYAPQALERDGDVPYAPEPQFVVQLACPDGSGNTAEGEGEGVSEGEGEGAPLPNSLTLTRSANSTTYSPNGTVNVTLTIDAEGSVELASLGLEETVPAGWVYDGIVSGTTPPSTPTVGDAGPLEFLWITVPPLSSFPVEFTYRVRITNTTTSPKVLSGLARWRAGTGNEQVSNGNNLVLNRGAKTSLLLPGDGLRSVAPAEVGASLESLLAWEGNSTYASILPETPEETCLIASQEIDGRTVRVGEPLEITVALEVPDTAAGASQIEVAVDLYDEQERLQTDDFTFSPVTLTGISAVDGTGTLATGATGRARFELVPLERAARTEEKYYRVETVVRFRSGGASTEVPLVPRQVLIRPKTEYSVSIYKPIEVFGEDPLSPEEDNSQPFDVGLTLTNNSSIRVRDARVERIEPFINEVDTGALNLFEALRRFDREGQGRPGLRATLGDVEPTKRGAAALRLRANSSGEVDDLYTAVSRMVPGQGRRIIVPDSVTEFRLVRAVSVNVGVADTLPDFAIDTTDDGLDIPTSLVVSNAGTSPINLATNVVVTESTELDDVFNVTSTFPFFVGYVEIPLPLDADPNLDHVERANGTIVPAENVWVSLRTMRNGDNTTTTELKVHIIDVSASGNYTVFMGAQEVIINEPPVADAGGSQNLFLNQTVTLEGRGSFDPESQPLTYKWTIDSTPQGGTGTFSSTTSETPTFTPTLRGVYVLRLTVSDGVNSNADTVRITVNNRAPVIAVGGDLQARRNQEVQLDASGTTDAENDPLDFVWTVTQRPQGSTATLGDRFVATPSFVPDVTGTYVFQVTVDDGFATAGPAEQRLVVTNEAPIASAGSDRSASPNTTIQLDGSSSFDPDGDTLTFTWSLVTRPAGSNAILQTPNRANASFVVDRQGDYVVQLRVSDGISTSIDEVNIATSNRAPTADAGVPQSAQVGATVQLDGRNSFDPDGDTLSFLWRLISQPAGSKAALANPTSPAPSFVIDVAGNYSVRLVVNDGSLTSEESIVTISTNNTPPVARAGNNQSAKVGDLVTLNGSQSSDADADQLLFVWRFRARPGGSVATLSNPNAVSPTFTVDQPGTYTVELTVFDGKSTSSPSSVTVSTENSVPIANAGSNKSAKVGDTVNLDGTGSSDPDGDDLTFSWSISQLPRGSTASLSGADTARPSLTVDRQGDFQIRLVVSDGTATSAPATVIVTTGNTPPTANAGADRASGVGQTVNLDGSGSTDPDGDSLAYTWSLTSVPEGSRTSIVAANTATPSITLDVAGSYVIGLVVNDGTVDSAPDSIIITTENTAPLARGGADIVSPLGSTITLDGSASTDADGDTINFAWSLIQRPATSAALLANPTSPRPTLTLDREGLYVAQLIVSDGKAASAPDTVQITTGTNNAAPVASAGADRTALFGQTIALDGSGSTDADGDSLTYQWSFVSRPEASTATLQNAGQEQASFVIDALGDFVVRLVVNDGETDSAPDTVTISTQNSVPTANAGADRTVEVGRRVQLDGTGSSDPDGDPLTYAWTLTSKPSGSNAQITNNTTSRPAFTPDLAGDFLFTLVVNDSKANSTPDTVLFTAEGGATEGEGEGEGGVDCVEPAAPATVLASDGTFDNRVEVKWDPVATATAYRVWRSSSEDVNTATPVSNWIPGTQFNDTDVPGPTTETAQGCQCSEPTVTFQFFFYWVQARVDVDCEGPLAGPDRGHRGAAAKSLVSDDTVRPRVLPGEVHNEITRKAAVNSPLYLRLTAPSGSLANFWGLVTTEGFGSDTVYWVGVPGDEAADGWVAYVPEAAWTPGTLVHFEAGGETTTGATVGSIGYDFVIVGAEQTAEAALVAHEGYADDEGFGPAWSLQPGAVYDAPVKLAVPLPQGLDTTDARLYYGYDDGTGLRWYRGDNVIGWMNGTSEWVTIDGQQYLQFRANHGGVLRLGPDLTPQPQTAEFFSTSNRGDLLVAAAFGVLLLAGSIARRRKRAR